MISLNYNKFYHRQVRLFVYFNLRELFSDEAKREEIYIRDKKDYGRNS